MDGQRFDHLAKLVAQHRLSRRAALRVVGGLAAVLGTDGFARETRARVATPAAGPATPAGVPLTVRKNAKDLSKVEKTAFVDAVLALKLKPSPWVPGLSLYDTFTLWHRDAFNCDINAAHMAPAFLPWHRAFLLLYEQQLREVDPTVSVPYWD